MRRDALLIGLLSLAVVAVLMVSGLAGASRSSSSSALRASAGLTVNLDQFANQAGQGWQNGDLNGNNSSYNEGLVVPFRYLITGLAVGLHSVHINYDFTAGGHEAYDFLATYNATETTVNLCHTDGGGAEPPAALCPGGNIVTADSTLAFPVDPFVVSSNGLSVSGAQTQAAGEGVTRNLLLWGGTITSIT